MDDLLSVAKQLENLNPKTPLAPGKNPRSRGAASAMKGLFSKLTDPVVIIGGIVGGLKALYNIQSRVFKQNAAAMKATEGHYGGGLMRGLENQRQLSEDITKNIGGLNQELGFIATKGLSEVNRQRKGDQIVRVNIKTLNNITSNTKNILQSLKEEVGDEVVFTKIK